MRDNNWILPCFVGTVGVNKIIAGCFFYIKRRLCLVSASVFRFRCRIDGRNEEKCVFLTFKSFDREIASTDSKINWNKFESNRLCPKCIRTS